MHEARTSIQLNLTRTKRRSFWQADLSWCFFVT